jgi:signal transduction histidine kinase
VPSWLLVHGIVGMAETRGNLFTLLRTRRQRLIDVWSGQVLAALGSDPLSRAELVDHMPLFVDELTVAVHPEAIPLPGGGTSAEQHGAQRLRLGFDAREVVREYGMLHSCILQLAKHEGVDITVEEHEVLVRSINAGMADAISQYVAQRDAEMQRSASEHIGFIAHEIRNPLSAARVAFDRLRARELASGGRLANLLDRNLKRTAEVIDSTLTHAWLKMGVPIRPESLPLRQFLEEIRLDAFGEAEDKGIDIAVVAPADLVIRADPRLLRSAIANLLLNAVKFSKPDHRVTIRAHQEDARILIEVADACGGLPPGRAEELFAPLVQRNENRSGFGLGLAIALQAAEAHNGTIKVRDLPGDGCVFTLDLPGGNKSPGG